MKNLLDDPSEGEEEPQGCLGPSYHGPNPGDYHYVDLATIADADYFPTPEQWIEAHPKRVEPTQDGVVIVFSGGSELELCPREKMN